MNNAKLEAEKRKYLKSAFWNHIGDVFKDRIAKTLNELSIEEDEIKLRRLQGKLDGLCEIFNIDRKFCKEVGLTPTIGKPKLDILKEFLNE